MENEIKPKSPCKTFNKKKAITCYKLRFNYDGPSFEHFELFRISNKTPREYYVFPIETLQKQYTRHISYHKSGAFHLREEDGSRIIPSGGEADNRRASLFHQAMSHLSGQLDGYCIAKGRNVSNEAIDTMIEIMDGYIIPPLKVFKGSDVLKKQKSFTIPMLMTPYQIEAQKIISEEDKKGNHTIINT